MFKPSLLVASSLPQPSSLRTIKNWVPQLIYEKKDSAKLLIHRGIEISKTYNDDTSAAVLFNQKAIAFFLEAEYGKAVTSLDSAININEKYQLWNRLIDNLNNKGYIYRVAGNYKVALNHFQMAANLADSFKIYKSQPITFSNLAILHRLTGNYFKSIELLEKAARIAIKEGQGIELANIYHNLGETYATKNEFENAAFYYDKVIQLSDNASIPFDPTNTYTKMAEILKKQGRIDAAIFYNKKVIELTKQKGYKVGEIQGLIQLGKCYMAKNNLAIAERYLVEGIFEASAIQRKDIVDDAYFLLSNIYEQKGNYKNALKLNKLGTALRDSINNAEAKRQLLEMQMLFASEQQQKNLKVLTTENLLNKVKIANKTNAIIFLSVAIILLILVVILYNAYGKAKAIKARNLKLIVEQRTTDLIRKERILSAQNKKLMEYAHMTSHVLRKPLANILGAINLIEIEKDDQAAKDEMFEVIKSSAYEMDETVIESINILSEKFDIEEDDFFESTPDLNISNSTKEKLTSAEAN